MTEIFVKVILIQAETEASFNLTICFWQKIQNSFKCLVLPKNAEVIRKIPKSHRREFAVAQ